MDRVDIDELDNMDDRAASAKSITGPLGLLNMSLNYYELEPGDVFSPGLHTHMNQEEVFMIVEGTATFETEDEDYEVGPGVVVRFPPGEFQQGRNDGEEVVRAFGAGAPREMGETRTPFPCSNCEAEYHTVEIQEEGFRLICPGCGNDFEI